MEHCTVEMTREHIQTSVGIASIIYSLRLKLLLLIHDVRKIGPFVLSVHLWDRPSCGNRPSCGTQPSCESYIYQRTNGPVNAHLISWPSTYKTWKIYG